MEKVDTKFKKGIHYSMATEFKKGMSPHNKGKTGLWSRDSRFVKSCLVCKKEFRVYKSAFNKRNTCSRICIDSTKVGKESWNKGNKGFLAGDKHYKWKKDRSTLAKRQERNDSAYGDWRKQVWLRDDFKCKIANPDCKGRLEAHHILGWTPHPELRYEVNNGITLCHFHHPRKRNDEMKLSPYFQELVKKD